MTERAVLAVSFGTSHRDTLEKNIAAIEAELAAAFPERTVRRAFTSGMILRLSLIHISALPPHRRAAVARRGDDGGG